MLEKTYSIFALIIIANYCWNNYWNNDKLLTNRILLRVLLKQDSIKSTSEKTTSCWQTGHDAVFLFYKEGANQAPRRKQKLLWKLFSNPMFWISCQRIPSRYGLLTDKMKKQSFVGKAHKQSVLVNLTTGGSTHKADISVTDPT